MPQSSDELRKKFMTPTDDGILKAEKILEKNFVITNGHIGKRSQFYDRMTEEEGDAIDYLVHEWDYWYEGA